MTRIANHFTKRHNLTAFNTSWDYSAYVTPEFDRLAWQYHTNARNVDNGNEKVMQNSPTWQVFSPITTKNVGPNDCINVNHYWPHTRWICIMVLMDAYINYGFQDWNNNEQSVSKFPFERPLPPKITYSRTQNHLQWVINARSSEMSDTSKYNRSRTRYVVQTSTPSSPYPNIPAYSANFGTAFTPNERTVTYDASDIGPDVPIKVRLVAINDGFTGESNWREATSEHVFSKPNNPIVKSITTDAGHAYIHVDPNVGGGGWHPCDKLILERQVASKCNPNTQWTAVGTYTTEGGINKLTRIGDGQDGRLPVTDQATWYRVRSVHDEDSNNATSNIFRSVYTAKPAQPTINSATWETGGVIHMSITRTSNMSVKTYLYVRDLSADGLPKVVEDYEITGGSSSAIEFDIQGVGGIMHFESDHVYEVGVYNKVWNDPDDHVGYVYADGGTLPQSNDTTVTVRGSAQAVAQAFLATPVITDVSFTSSGKAAVVSWTQDGEDELTVTVDDIGTYIEWTDAEGGWNSTEAPKSYKRSEKKGAFGTNVGIDNNSITINGLTEGTTYQIRLRRYVTLENEDGYGKADTAEVTPWSTPTNVALQAPGFVLPGESVRYTWTFTDEGDTPQSSAILTVNGFPYAVTGSAGSYVVDVPESMEGETLTATVRVACNGGYSDPSAEVVTTVAERPTCTLALPSCETSTDYGGHTLTALPLEVTVGGSGDTFRVRVTSNGGALSPEPAGGRELAAGEVVATEVFSGEGTYEVDGSMIIGGGNYDVECVCVDTTTGMESDPVTLGFTALWAEAAVIPSGTVQIEDGMAYITPVEGADAPEGESCRIWRKVADGYVLACENAIWGERHLDRVPAYGSDELAYVIEAVSADGDHKWAEVPYTLAGTDARITFGGQTVSLPWNLQPKSSYAKGFERRAHMDGHRAGFWEPGVDRDWALSSGYLRDDRAHTDELREVGRYDGLCYVRGPRGVGFAANVDVDVSLTYDSAEANVDITCAEVADDGTFAIVVEPRDEDTEDEGEGA